MDRPQSITDIRSLIGAVNYYKSFWPRQAHILTPLTELTGNRKFTWTKRQQESFDEVKAILAADAINAYPDYNLPFDICTDASDYQLGAAILQNGRPVAYFSRKLNKSQQNYTTTEKELLAIVLCLKEY